jgi:hypothetical protein
MNRDCKIVCTGGRLVAGFLVLVALMASLGSGIARAGDEDGVNGYSMRLKNKDFTSENGSGGGFGVIILDQKKSEPMQPQVVNGRSQLPERFSFTYLVRSWIWRTWLIR